MNREMRRIFKKYETDESLENKSEEELALLIQSPDLFRKKKKAHKKKKKKK